MWTPHHQRWRGRDGGDDGGGGDGGYKRSFIYFIRRIVCSGGCSDERTAIGVAEHEVEVDGTAALGEERRL